MVPFKDATAIARNLSITIFLVLVVIFWWIGGREKEVVVETDSFVPIVADIPPPIPAVVEIHSDGNTRVKVDTVNINPVFEHHDHHVLVKETVIVRPPEPKPEPEVVIQQIKQSPLIQYRDMRVPRESSMRVYYSGGYSGRSYYHHSGGGWNSRNAPVRTPNPPGCGFNTQGCR
jgi:hypothetical protein